MSNLLTGEISHFCLKIEFDFMFKFLLLELESPDLSLLIQNKAKETVTVSISAPSFVHLEKKKIQLLEKESNKVEYAKHVTIMK